MKYIKNFDDFKSSINEQEESVLERADRDFYAKTERIAKDIYDMYDDIINVWNMCDTEGERSFENLVKKYDVNNDWVCDYRKSTRNGDIVYLDFQKYSDIHFLMSVNSWRNNESYNMTLTAEHENGTSATILFSINDKTPFKVSNLFKSIGGNLLMGYNDNYTYEYNGKVFLERFDDYKHMLSELLYDLKNDISNADVLA